MNTTTHIIVFFTSPKTNLIHTVGVQKESRDGYYDTLQNDYLKTPISSLICIKFYFKLEQHNTFLEYLNMELPELLRTWLYTNSIIVDDAVWWDPHAHTIIRGTPTMDLIPYVWDKSNCVNVDTGETERKKIKLTSFF